MSTLTIDPTFTEHFEAEVTEEGFVYLYRNWAYKNDDGTDSPESVLLMDRILKLPFDQLASLYFNYFNTEEDNIPGERMFEELLSRMTSVTQGLTFIGASDMGGIRFEKTFAKMLELEATEAELENLADFFSERWSIRNRDQIRKIFDRADTLDMPQD